uniref:WAP domain-containing protein n=2 Tax=Meloidogyne hapla TaxID=6305 RepID=A0A1I8B6D7_MELHA
MKSRFNNKLRIFKLIFIIFINFINSSNVKNDEELISISPVKINPVDEHEIKEDEIFEGECPAINNINQNIPQSTTEWCPVQCLNDLDCSELTKSRCCPTECGGWKCISIKSFSSSSPRPPVQIQPLKNTLYIQKLNGQKNKNEEENNKREQIDDLREEIVGNSPINSILLRPNIANPLLKCEPVKCINPLYKCQLVETDCLSSPCPTVAKCLLNPCPNGSPMMLSNGVTALCKRAQQCWEGYNGLGFCCPEPKKLSKPGICPFKKSSTNYRLNDKKCQAKCKTDENCFGKEEKCCFNGCGLNCLKINEELDGNDELNNNEDKNEFVIQRPLQTKIKPKIKTSMENQQQITELSQIKKQIKENHNEIKQTKKSGNCPKIFLNQINTTIIQQICKINEIKENECIDDNDCEGFQKCCSDICGNKLICLYPEGASKCILMRMAAEIFSKFSDYNKLQKPKCDRFGHYLPIQNFDGFTWCVDNLSSTGIELYGTRAPNDVFRGCELRRICPLIHCELKCPFGYKTFQMDGLGCPQCICRSPLCDSIQCPIGAVCRFIRQKCEENNKNKIFNYFCLIPQCLLNTCLRGEPIEDLESGELKQCNEQKGIKCPPGFYCQKLGIGENGYCCSGLVLQNNLIVSATKCPSFPNLLYRQNLTELTGNSEKQILECRLTSECKEGKICCFNGWGSECFLINQEKEENIKIITVKKGKNEENERENIKYSSGLSKELSEVLSSKQCPIYLQNATNPGCVSNCLSDADCIERSEHSICCQVGCGRKCKFPEMANLCINLLETTLKELDKLSSIKHLINKKQQNKLILPQCDSEGNFNNVQFDSLLGQYWCVDKLKGIEISGTRTSVSPLDSTTPNCSNRHKCPFNCLNKKEEFCKFGFKLDHKGCFINENCECKNPCETFKCSLPESEVCILKQIKCLNSPCPLIPKCILNICQNSKLFNSFDENKNIKICTKNSAKCSDNEECLFLPEFLEEENGELIGLCCSRNEENEQKKLLDSSEIKLIALQSETKIQTTTEEITTTIFEEDFIDENDYKCENPKHPALDKLLKLPIYCNPNEENNYCPANFKCIRKPFLEEKENNKLGICCEL